MPAGLWSANLLSLSSEHVNSLDACLKAAVVDATFSIDCFAALPLLAGPTAL